MTDGPAGLKIGWALVAAWAAPSLVLAAAFAGVVTGDAYGADRISACERAQVEAKGAAVLDSMRKGGPSTLTYTRIECICDEDKAATNPALRWKCISSVEYKD